MATDTPMTWMEFAMAVFPNSRSLTPEERAAFDNANWADLYDSEPIAFVGEPAATPSISPERPFGAEKHGETPISGVPQDDSQ